MEGDDRKRQLEDELRRIDDERDDTLFRLRLERMERARSDDAEGGGDEPSEGPSTLRLRYAELEARRREVKAVLRDLSGP